MLLGVNDTKKFNTITTRTITIDRYIHVPSVGTTTATATAYSGR